MELFVRGIKYLKDIRYFWGYNYPGLITWVFTLSSSNHLFIHTIRNNTAACFINSSPTWPLLSEHKEGFRCWARKRGGVDLMKALASVSDSSCQRLHQHLCPKPNPQHALPATLITFRVEWTRRIDRQVQRSWLIKIIKTGRGGRGGGISMCGQLLLMGKQWGDVRAGREHWFTLWQQGGLRAWQGFMEERVGGGDGGEVPFTSSGP